MKKIFSAYTTFPNTEETDQMPEVLHDVSMEINGTAMTIEILAQDPMLAIEKAHNMTEEQCLIARKSK